MDDDDEGPALEPHWPRPTPRRSRCLCHSTDLRSVERRACARLTKRGQAIREWKPKRPLDVAGGRGGQHSCQSMRRARSTYHSICTSRYPSPTEPDEPAIRSMARCGRRGLTTDGRGRRGRAQKRDMKVREVRSAGLDDRWEGTERAGAGERREGEEGVAGQERGAVRGVYCTAAHVSLPTAG